ncbi:uncharacterized protein A1O9_09414 [Exophiala aquamarina CBS 119918]|uniref:CENP-V/GFA domain-containing protein n=1 Tax=Exophiala aquamarina CBS 119918 TaxID=1182545 RepID=A0A072P4R2_9EURO|nr:uncharacterized protein A1O9_09414 [Exophiala aquamarina CBS 119918]KEF54248.1 hypothetical protein A1O9_09414 [Exophiala aquamarina CBS 119918]
MSSTLAHEIPVNVRCHCGHVAFNLKVPKEMFPLKSSLCHCRSCRHATGQLFATFAVIPTAIPSEIHQDNSDSLAVYRSSSTILRFFCKNCGASIANFDSAGDGECELATGCLDFPGEISGHEYKLNRVQLWVEDVKGDGGAAGWINAGKLAGMDRHWRGRDSPMVSDANIEGILAGEHGEQPIRSSGESEHRGRDDELNFRCHCDIVSLNISRPDEQYNQATGKFESGLDACTSCRLVTGFEITGWARVPQELINTPAPSFNAYLADRSRLKHYKTSADVSRYFCGTCGATVFYQKHGLDTIDIGIGLLDPPNPEDARAEDWLVWQKYPTGMSYPENAIDQKFVKDLADGLRSHKGAGDV